ncbi:MAG TPA: GNAT family protein [Actinospica sp.]|nr:GNAT family protein [Actinospica sp.]
MSVHALLSPLFERHPLVPASPWLEAPTLEGRHVVLEELRLEHAAELFHALNDEEVWRHLPGAAPRSEEDMAAYVTGILRANALGVRTTWVYRDPRSGALIGMSSYVPPEEKLRSVHIGGTMTARPYWRSGVNSEAKLLLMTHAFETLGAVRIEWQTDDLNLRSQAAIERLGAVREGVLRSHKPRRDGTRRNSVFYGLLVDEWPAAKERLLARLAAHD